MNNPIDKIFDTRDLIEHIGYLAQSLVDSWNEREDTRDNTADDITSILGEKGQAVIKIL